MKMLELKKKTTMLILEKLHTCIPCDLAKVLLANTLPTGTLTGASISRMAYDRFDEFVTERHHVVVRNWPLKKFCNPSNITSRIKLELLYNAWQSGATYFQKLTQGEMEAWESDRFSSRMESMGPPAEPVPALALPQTSSTEMTLFSELPRQDRLNLAPVVTPSLTRDVPLAPITNLTSASTTTSHPQAPNPDMIAMMIRADPALQNVNPTLIAMGIAVGSSQHQVAVATSRNPPAKQPPGHSSKRHWQEVVTPVSFNSCAAKKPRKERKEKN